VISRAINKAVREGYYTRIPKERYPVAVLSLDIDPGEVDVNVHPRKAEVRFSREKEIGDAVTLAIEKVLSESNLVTEIRERRDRIQKTFEIPESSGRLQVSEAAEIFGKIVTGKTRSTHGTSNFPESGGALREKAERYSYPVKDTERKLKKSERLLDFTSKDGILGIPDNRNPDLRVIGQVSRLYILAEKGEDLVLIDQHAAHERILYEQILRMKKSRVQELITPITIDLTPKEKVLMEEYIPYLEDYGFGISEFGDNTYVVTFVPEVFGRLEGSEIIHDVVSDLLASGRVKKDTGISERVCKTLACRAAIKAGAACSPGQMEELIEQLKKAENPYSCPHGRPTVITFTKGELDRMFARIQ
jgi:DNA mismatch repair protein MutL